VFHLRLEGPAQGGTRVGQTGFKKMYLDFTAEQQRLRQEIRQYYRDLFTPELRAALDQEWHEVGGPVYREVVARMGGDGWLGIG
jgi:alkylation response protein AidB-like acyl-CoA dehydrogenase